jgi:type VI secretion system secreted protein VgrG
VQTGRDRRMLRLLEAPGPFKDYTVTNFSGREAMSELFEFTLECETAAEMPHPKSFVGQPASFVVWPSSGSKRFFNGMVRSCTIAHRHEINTRFTLQIVPNLWLATQRKNCRVFEDTCVTDILLAVLGGYPEVNWDATNITCDYFKLPLISQFFESDFNFLSRLLEREGIYFYFQSDEGMGERFKHRMILSDIAAGYHRGAIDTVPYLPNANTYRAVRSYSANLNSQVGQFMLRDYDYRAPKLDLEVSNQSVLDWADKEGLNYLYPGGYRTRNQGERLVRLAAEREEAKAEQTYGTSDVQLLAPGMMVTIDHRQMDDDHKRIVITSIDHQARDSSLTSRGSDSVYANSFSALPAKRVFRPQLNADRTKMFGPQTGYVVGPKGEDVHTDKEGRIRVKFHWDRDTKKPDEGSFWCRVAQVWAGNGYGAQVIPRIGMEVLINFIGGDPDRPIVVGCVYNGVNKSPWPLPAQKTKTGIRSRSSTGGATRNELVMEDKAKSELFRIFAGRDSERIVENDEKIEVKRDQSTEIGRDQSLHVKRNDKEKIDGKWQVDIGKTVDIVAGERITLRVGGSSITISHSGVRIDGPRIDYTSNGPISIRSETYSLIQAPVTEIKGGALANVQAGLVKIN